MKNSQKSQNDSSSGANSKLLGKKDRKQNNQAAVSDMGVTSLDQVASQVNAQENKFEEDSFEKYYNKDLDLDEDQVPIVIYELNESAINFISQECYEKALILLQKAQTMLEQIQADKTPKDKFVYLLTLHNMGMCYQKLGILEECALCLEACLDHLKGEYLQAYFNDPRQPSLRLKMIKYQCKTHMQICALLSQIHKHKEAVFHANAAIMISHFLISDCENMAAHYSQEILQGKSIDEISIFTNNKYSLLEKTSIKLLPIFQAIRSKMAHEDNLPIEKGGVKLTGPYKRKSSGGKGKGQRQPSFDKSIPMQLNEKSDQESLNKNDSSIVRSDKFAHLKGKTGSADMKNILGYLNQGEWIYSLNIGNIMQIAPLTLQDFMSCTSLQVELTREFVLEKLCFLAVSYFCMGTEFRFLHQLNERIDGQEYERRDSEYWHGKAVEMVISFLPSESPLVSHILMSYEKHHSPSNMVIPESESQDKKVRVVRQLYGIDSNKLQPIIRAHPDTEYKIPKMTIKPFNYDDILSYDPRKRADNRAPSGPKHKRKGTNHSTENNVEDSLDRFEHEVNLINNHNEHSPKNQHTQFSHDNATSNNLQMVDQNQLFYKHQQNSQNQPSQQDVHINQKLTKKGQQSQNQQSSSLRQQLQSNSGQGSSKNMAQGSGKNVNSQLQQNQQMINKIQTKGKLNPQNNLKGSNTLSNGDHMSLEMINDKSQKTQQYINTVNRSQDGDLQSIIDDSIALQNQQKSDIQNNSLQQDSRSQQRGDHLHSTQESIRISTQKNHQGGKLRQQQHQQQIQNNLSNRLSQNDNQSSNKNFPNAGGSNSIENSSSLLRNGGNKVVRTLEQQNIQSSGFLNERDQQNALNNTNKQQDLHNTTMLNSTGPQNNSQSLQTQQQNSRQQSAEGMSRRARSSLANRSSNKAFTKQQLGKNVNQQQSATVAPTHNQVLNPLHPTNQQNQRQGDSSSQPPALRSNNSTKQGTQNNQTNQQFSQSMVSQSSGDVVHSIFQSNSQQLNNLAGVNTQSMQAQNHHHQSHNPNHSSSMQQPLNSNSLQSTHQSSSLAQVVTTNNKLVSKTKSQLMDNITNSMHDNSVDNVGMMIGGNSNTQGGKLMVNSQMSNNNTLPLSSTSGNIGGQGKSSNSNQQNKVSLMAQSILSNHGSKSNMSQQQSQTQKRFKNNPQIQQQNDSHFQKNLVPTVSYNAQQMQLQQNQQQNQVYSNNQSDLDGSQLMMHGSGQHQQRSYDRADAQNQQQQQQFMQQNDKINLTNVGGPGGGNQHLNQILISNNPTSNNSSKRQNFNKNSHSNSIKRTVKNPGSIQAKNQKFASNQSSNASAAHHNHSLQQASAQQQSASLFSQNLSNHQQQMTSLNSQSQIQTSQQAIQNNDSLLMMIKKREKFNNSAAMMANQPTAPNNRLPMQQSSTDTNNNGNVNGNEVSVQQQQKVYLAKRTPTSLGITNEQQYYTQPGTNSNQQIQGNVTGMPPGKKGANSSTNATGQRFQTSAEQWNSMNHQQSQANQNQEIQKFLQVENMMKRNQANIENTKPQLTQNSFNGSRKGSVETSKPSKKNQNILHMNQSHRQMVAHTQAAIDIGDLVNDHTNQQLLMNTQGSTGANSQTFNSTQQPQNSQQQANNNGQVPLFIKSQAQYDNWIQFQKNKSTKGSRSNSKNEHSTNKSAPHSGHQSTTNSNMVQKQLMQQQNLQHLNSSMGANPKQAQSSTNASHQQRMQLNTSNQFSK